MTEHERERAPETEATDMETTLRAALGRGESPGLSSAFDHRLADSLAADHPASRRSWKRRRRLQRFTLATYSLVSLVVMVAVLIRLPPPQDPRVMALSLATLIFVVGASAALTAVLWLVRREVG